MIKLITIYLIKILILLIFSISTSKATEPFNCGSKDPIIIPLHEWSSQKALSVTVGEMFKRELQCNIEYIDTDPYAVYEMIRLGDATLQLEIWERAFGTTFQAAIDKGGIIDAGTHDAVTREGWWVPDFVISMCPGLPHWKALNECSEIFAQKNSHGMGVYIDAPVAWGHDKERAKNLNMNFEIINVSRYQSLWSDLKVAARDKKAIVLFNWSPNFPDVYYGGKFIEFPPWTKECFINPLWGPNPKVTGDCGDPPGGYLKKAAWDRMPIKWPLAYKALKRINFTTEIIGTLTMYMDIEGLQDYEAANKWISENPDIIYSWFHSPM